MNLASASNIMNRAFSRAVAPPRPGLVSEWAERHRVLSAKGSAEAGPWRNSRNPPQVEIMDCASARSPVRDAVAILPIQFGKSEIEMNILGYTMTENPMPIIVALPAEVSMNKLIDQKINPLIEETPAIQKVLVSLNSRETSNRRTFKDFEGGQLYIEHAGAPVRLKSTSAGMVLADEFSSFANELGTGDDPVSLLDGRTTTFVRAKRFKVGTPETVGACRLTELWERSDQRLYHVPCPDCGHEQPLTWSGLQFTADGRDCWYVCADCGAMIREHQKTQMIARGRWVAGRPGVARRGYQINALYYPVGLGLTWLELVREFLDAQGEPAKLKTFINDRLAEAWEDPTTRHLREGHLRDRAEAYRLRIAPTGVLCITAGVDTQDDRLAVQIIGWGRGLRAWTLDYIELPGDPADEQVWNALTTLINTPIEHETGALMRVEATAIDAGGHRTEDVKHYVRQHRIRRPMAIFGARNANAPVLSRPKLADVTWEGKTDARGVHIYQVGGIDITHRLYARLGTDAEKAAEDRLVHFSEELEPEFFAGILSEVWNPRRGRYERRRGRVEGGYSTRRNEPLDTWKYAYAATHHQELRLHRAGASKWAALEQALADNARQAGGPRPLPPPLPAAGAAAAGQGDQAPAPVPAAEQDAAITLRSAVFQAVSLLDREPDTALDSATIERWRQAVVDGPDEARLHAELVSTLANHPGQAIAACLGREMVDRLRRYLAGLPAANLTSASRRPPRRRVRSAGIR